jgi:hypothetical protein
MAYTFVDNWIRIPDSETARTNGRTHGVTVTREGNVIILHQAHNGLLTYDPDGQLISAVGGDRWMGGHGLTRIEQGGEEFLWVVDVGSMEVAKTTLSGETVMTIDKPDIPDYQGEKPGAYIPTWAAENPLNGEVWVANGYGADIVHRYAKDGSYMETLRGSEEAGKFLEPHGLCFRTVGDNVELWITDRANHQIQVFDGDGRFLRSSMNCHSPCCFDFRGDTVLVPELFTGAKVLDANTFEVLEEVGANEHISPKADGSWWPPIAPEGWPNLAGTDWVQPGRLNSPHGGTFDADGNIYIVEWVVGGRVTKYVKA